MLRKLRMLSVVSLAETEKLIPYNTLQVIKFTLWAIIKLYAKQDMSLIQLFPARDFADICTHFIGKFVKTNEIKFRSCIHLQKMNKISSFHLCFWGKYAKMTSLIFFPQSLIARYLFGQKFSNPAPDVWYLLNVKIALLCLAEMVKPISCKALTQNVRDNTCFAF